MRVPLAVLLVGFPCGLCGQTPAVDARPTDPATYEAFFRQVLNLKSAENTKAHGLNGEPVAFTVPKLQDVIGLTDREVGLLQAAAADCLQAGQSFEQPSAKVFEARLQEIESGRVSGALGQELKELDGQHNRWILDRVQQLKLAFGDLRFQVLDAYVRSGKGQKELRPVVAAPATAK
jgi:hypothetical protein